VRSVSIWKGLDPRDLTLVAFGGAGGLVAGPVAQMLDIPTVLVPPVPGNSCAMGTLMTDFQEDTAVAYLSRADQVELDAINERLEALREQTLAALVAQGAEESDVSLSYIADIRYYGQSHELRIPLDEFPVTYGTIEKAINTFEETYEEVYTIKLTEGLPEFVSLRVTARVALPHYEVDTFTGGTPDFQPKSSRQVLDGGEEWAVDVYDRYTLPAGTTLEGPVILEESGATIWVAPNMGCSVDERGNLIINTDVRRAGDRQPALAQEA
jgi:N-methylhydantoinase A